MLPADRAEPVERAIERLCLVADLDEPLTALVADDVPLSWTTAPPGKRPRVHITTGMVELLDDAELQAVLAHELSHIGDRDAVVPCSRRRASASCARCTPAGVMRPWSTGRSPSRSRC
jgi:heat shock protein HtpX